MKCVYLGYNPDGFYRQGSYGCTCRNHPGYSQENGWALFGTSGGVPYPCQEGGNGCPIFQQQLNGNRGNQF